MASICSQNQLQVSRSPTLLTNTLHTPTSLSPILFPILFPDSSMELTPLLNGILYRFKLIWTVQISTHSNYGNSGKNENTVNHCNYVTMLNPALLMTLGSILILVNNITLTTLVTLVFMEVIILYMTSDNWTNSTYQPVPQDVLYYQEIDQKEIM